MKGKALVGEENGSIKLWDLLKQVIIHEVNLKDEDFEYASLIVQ